jgi:Fe-S cluster biogenesis protein NfuA
MYVSLHEEIITDHPMIEAAAVEIALDTLRPGLAEEGFDLRVGEITGDDVRVVLEARPGACLDCLVPDEFILSMVEDLIHKQGAAPGSVELVKQGFDAAGS